MFAALAASSAFAQQVYSIYDGRPAGSEDWTYPEITMNGPSGRPLIYNVSDPTITVYKPEAAIDTKAAMIICPGGANMYLTWEEEGINVAQWCQRNGITGIILKYRTQQLGENEEEVQKKVSDMLSMIFGERDKAGAAADKMKASAKDKKAAAEIPSGFSSKPQPSIQGDDGRQAIKYVRQHAEELGIDPHKIGIVGFSAGGALVMNVVMINDEESRPDFAAPIYGVGGISEVPENPMPLFVCGPEFDLGPADGAFAIYKAWQEAKQPAELHFIHDASHGEGILYNGREWLEWTDMMLNFMKAVKFVD